MSERFEVVLEEARQARREDRPDDARSLYEEAVALCREENDPLRLAHTIRHLGDVHLDAARLDLAEGCYGEALALYRGDAHTKPLDLANTLRPFAILEERLCHNEQALVLWTEARDLYRAVNVQEGVAECTRRISKLGG